MWRGGIAKTLRNSCCWSWGWQAAFTLGLNPKPCILYTKPRHVCLLWPRSPEPATVLTNMAILNHFEIKCLLDLHPKSSGDSATKASDVDNVRLSKAWNSLCLSRNDAVSCTDLDVLAVECSVLCGKWMILSDSASVDMEWSKICLKLFRMFAMFFLFTLFPAIWIWCWGSLWGGLWFMAVV